ncbi:hypothetical protein CGLO_13814 [Colletotrichum gloeosporioides Cg-14]|uniref:Uncharacterized protein n=1 Tax=Colletotrichum gloeosporioides (strain Cg-14) TaxID=1237896 RepID=T0LFN4_COLGC|nr:hypothetical protein CGLO_13814 [Colletotrichum gloeosporioides Cg-14]
MASRIPDAITLRLEATVDAKWQPARQAGRVWEKHDVCFNIRARVTAEDERLRLVDIPKTRTAVYKLRPPTSDIELAWRYMPSVES